MKFRYEINISIMLMLGVVFLIWGLNMFGDGLKNRKNLRNIHGAEVNVMELKENEYVKVPRIYLMTSDAYRDTNGQPYPVAFTDVSLAFESAYYIAHFDENSNEYIVLKVPKKYEDFEEYKVTNSMCDFENPPVDIKEHAKDFKFAVKVVKKDKNYNMFIGDLDGYEVNSDNVEINHNLMLQVVDLERERKTFPAGICILLAGIVLTAASRPWKIITKREAAPDKEFNLIYHDREKPDDEDIRLIEDIARDLRNDISYYDRRYKELKNNIVRSVVAYIISLIVFIKIKTFITLFIITILFFIRLLVSIFRLIINQDTAFARHVSDIFNRIPVLQLLNDRKRKLEKCDTIIKASIQRDDETTDTSYY